MKYAIVIPDGAADLPIDELGGKTPLAAADIPNMDWIAANGKCGTVRNVPAEMPCGSDVAIMSVLGYDPKKYYSGRAPLEAAARGLKIEPDEWVFRCNLVTIIDGIMEDHSAGNISSEESAALIEELNRILANDQLRFYPGVSYRNLMTFAGKADVTTTPPHDILGEPVAPHLPKGHGGDIFATLIDRSEVILTDAEINRVRRDLGENPATHIWLWGQGRMPQLPKFAERFGITSAASISAVDLVRGLSKLIGWDHIEIPGATGFVDTNYAGKGAAAVEALVDHDLVFVHVEAPDEAGHQADVSGKVHAVEQIDRHIVGPLLEYLRGLNDWRILVLPDHPTPCSLRTHTSEPVPFALAGKRIESVIQRTFTEDSATASDLHIANGWELMEFFLKVR